jgi:OmcA/MtrC family decaheme c-type cytochrome
MKTCFPAKWKERRVITCLLLCVATVAAAGVTETGPTASGAKVKVNQPIQRAVTLPEQEEFVNSGLLITINSAQISSSGAISVTYTIADSTGLPLDAAGQSTPGVVSLAFVASYIPQGQEQYVAYTTSQVTGPALGTVTRPNFELGGTPTQIAPGQYQYTFSAQAPRGFDPTATTTVAVDGNRDLSPFGLPISYAGTTFNFVPNGAPVTTTRDVIRTQSCNTCHDQLAFHGGYAHGMEMCVLCHQPQNVDPTSGNSLDLKVMAHAIHMGSSLPSVVGTETTPGVPYEIYGFMNSVDNFSTVVDPSMAQRCEVCHSQTTGAAQATAFLTEPSRVACGSCHNDVNFATGANHPAGVQTDDTQCATCHVPQGQQPFDASILGAHVVATDTPSTYPSNPNTLISSVVVNITGVTNTNAGQNPVVAFTLQNIDGNALALSSVASLRFTMAGPTTDYGYTSFGSTVTTPGYVQEDGTKGTCDGNGNCTYMFIAPVPAGATGTYAIGAESERTESILANTSAAQSVTTGTPNPVTYFPVDGSPVSPRRTVIAETNCNQCHTSLQAHGANRNNPEYCVMCHNPSNTDVSERPAGSTPQTINFAVMIHRIHDGPAVVADGGQPYIVDGYKGSVNNFSGVLYPGMSPAGDAPYLQNCSLCHVNGSEQTLPVGLNAVVDPQGWINPAQATASACSGCHASKAEASHFLANTDSLGESCTVCHSAGAAFAVDASHIP